MKYLIQHKKEFSITVAGFIMAIIALVNALKAKELNEDAIITVIFTALAVLGWFYNMPTSEENSYHTDVMRLEKEKEDLADDYYEEEDDDEDGEGLDKDEESAEDVDDGPDDVIPEDGEYDE